MTLEPIVWEMFDITQLAKLPLSFRVTGGYVTVPDLMSTEIEEMPSDLTSMAEVIIEWCNRQLDENKDKLALERLISDILQKAYHGAKNSYLVALVAALIAAKRHDEARTICVEAVQREDAGGLIFNRPDKRETFPEGALRWLDQNDGQRSLS